MEKLRTSIQTYNGNAVITFSYNNENVGSTNVHYSGDDIDTEWDIDEEDECIDHNMSCVREEIFQAALNYAHKIDVEIDEEDIDNVIGTIRIYVGSLISDTFAMRETIEE